MKCIFGELDCKQPAAYKFYRKDDGKVDFRAVGVGEVPSYCFKHAEITLANEQRLGR